MSSSNGPNFGFFALLLLIAVSIDFPGNPVRRFAFGLLAAFQSSFGGSGGFLQ